MINKKILEVSGRWRGKKTIKLTGKIVNSGIKMVSSHSVSTNVLTGCYEDGGRGYSHMSLKPIFISCRGGSFEDFSLGICLKCSMSCFVILILFYMYVYVELSWSEESVLENKKRERYCGANGGGSERPDDSFNLKGTNVLCSSNETLSSFRRSIHTIRFTPSRHLLSQKVVFARLPF